MKKAYTAKEAKELKQIPNVGKAVAEDLRRLKIYKPADLKNKDGIKLYQIGRAHV